ncbi:hypothetical protein WAX86_14475 [Photobacterium damselae subsp. damselae]|uniref:hypothetical protein n=1 Tax=Photobacterium damselae TaxID=38293 RepID=UPI00311B0928
MSATGLHLNIDETSNAIDINLAFEVADYFQVKAQKAHEIFQQLIQIISGWESLAQKEDIPKGERNLMGECFITDEYLKDS